MIVFLLLESVLSVIAAPVGVDLWKAYSGREGFPTCYRQPVLTVLNSSHLIAFAEGRVNGYCSGGADGSNSSIWARNSNDRGKTWSEAQMLFDSPPQPDYLSALYDSSTGRTSLFIMTSPNLVTFSDNAGSTWSKPSPIVINLPSGYTATPGVAHGLRVEGGLCPEPTCNGTAGRLIVAWVCHSKNPTLSGNMLDTSCPGCYSCLAVSDDAGGTWSVSLAAVASPQEGSREASLVQLRSSAYGAKGAVIYATERNMGASPGHRWHAISMDGGSSLSNFGVDPSIPDGVTKNWTGIVAGAARVGAGIIYVPPQAC